MDDMEFHDNMYISKTTGVEFSQFDSSLIARLVRTTKFEEYCKVNLREKVFQTASLVVDANTMHSGSAVEPTVDVSFFERQIIAPSEEEHTIPLRTFVEISIRILKWIWLQAESTFKNHSS